MNLNYLKKVFLECAEYLDQGDYIFNIMYDPTIEGHAEIDYAEDEPKADVKFSDKFIKEPAMEKLDSLFHELTHNYFTHYTDAVKRLVLNHYVPPNQLDAIKEELEHFEEEAVKRLTKIFVRHSDITWNESRFKRKR